MNRFAASLLITSLVTTKLTSCRSETVVRQPEPGTVIGHPDSTWNAVAPLDTAMLLQQLTLRDSGGTSMSKAPGAGREPREDTIVVGYIAYACTCPDHEVEDTSKAGGIGAFYIEPAPGCPTIPWRAQVTGNRFELIGHRSTAPMSPPETMGPPQPGYFFTYRSYRILRPYHVWGPHRWEPPSSGDSAMWVPTRLEVR